MVAKIRVLDDITINKIAAGEVIENASSVVKELIENSLDADATEIVIEVQAGGRSLIRVSDNGTGMGPDDAILCLERHATSKLKTVDDFSTLTSMGFRGEALPSIASISKFSLHTSEGTGGTLVRMEGGHLLGATSALRPQGTTVEAKDLFYNVPARKKFLKSPTSDENEIEKVCLQEALARPEIKLQLIVNQKTRLLLLPANPKERIAAALGNVFCNDLLPLNRTETPYHLGGYIGKPEAARPSRLGQYLFINGRPVFSSYIAWAIKEAFSTHLPQSRYPTFVLWLTLPPEEIDINVHPQKKEVRLRHEGAIKTLCFQAVHDALSRSRAPTSIDWVLDTVAPLPWEYHPKEPDTQANERELPLIAQPKIIPNVLTTLKGYILAETAGKEGFSLIDQARAHARILFEKLTQKSPKTVEKVALLIPLIIELPPSEAAILKEHLSELHLIGFEIAEFGPHSFAIHAYPALYEEKAVVPMLMTYVKEEKEQVRRDVAYRSASLCIGSEKCLSKEEALHLIKELFACELPWESPLGKPTMIHLDLQQLTKSFSL